MYLMRTRSALKSRCLAALSMDCAGSGRAVSARLSLGDSERSRLFAALLGLLKRDDLQVKRSDVRPLVVP